MTAFDDSFRKAIAAAQSKSASRQIPLYGPGMVVVGYVSQSTKSIGASKKLGTLSAEWTRGPEGYGWKGKEGQGPPVGRDEVLDALNLATSRLDMIFAARGKLPAGDPGRASTAGKWVSSEGRKVRDAFRDLAHNRISPEAALKVLSDPEVVRALAPWSKEAKS